jgi:hypothetical protein
MRITFIALVIFVTYLIFNQIDPALIEGEFHMRLLGG